MTVVSTRSGEIEFFRTIIARRFGLHFEDSQMTLLADVLRTRVEATGLADAVYLGRLEAVPAKDELAALAQELTVGETYFFRNHDQFRAFVEVSLPERMRAQAARRRLRLLSAGCASGEEAYSLAILVRQHVPLPSWEVSISGVDINRAALDRAARARFSPWALRETAPDTQRRWFRTEGRDTLLDDLIRTSVRFVERNLIEDDPELWEPHAYDVVFCRNVLMYLTPESAHALIGRITRSLVPGGYLFLGHAETLRGLSLDFHLCHTHGTFYYQRKEQLEPHLERPLRATPLSSRFVAASLLAVVESSDTWVEAIGRASERIHALTQSPPQAVLSRPDPVGPMGRSDLGAALDLLQQERFSEALTLVQTLPSNAEGHADVLLLRAVLLTHSGKLGAAEGFCGTLLEIDDLNAGAHYVLALCREGAGDRQGSIDHDQMAVYLDRTFAMPRLHLGLIARKGGDRETARREFEQALVLLRQEDASRLLLFGGGFGRAALIALCQGELVACGGRL